MTRKVRSWMWLAALVAAVICPSTKAQPPAAPAPAAPAKAAPAKGAPRKLAPGVMLSVDTARDLQESFSRHDVVELLAVDPNFNWAKDVTFRHNIWALQFEFKPVRMMHIDLPRKNGLMQKKLRVTLKRLRPRMASMVRCLRIRHRTAIRLSWILRSFPRSS